MSWADQDRVSRLLAALKLATAAAAYEAAGKSGDMDPCVRALVGGVLCVGPAYTVRTPAWQGDEMVAAADAAPAGSVIVIEVGADDGCAWGGTGTVVAQRRGVAGCVTNAHVRDIAEIRQAGFPVFARGATVRGVRRGVRGEAQVPVSVGGQVVSPGDLICADDDGVVVIPARRFADFEAALAARMRFEQEAGQLARDGSSYADIVARKPA